MKPTNSLHCTNYTNATNHKALALPDAPTRSPRLRSERTRTWIALCLGLGAVVLTCSASAQSWQTVLDYQYAPDRYAWGTGLATDPTGTLIYAAGSAADASWTWHAIALLSSDAGATWSLMDDYVTPDNSGYDAGITVDVHGNIYAAGASSPSSGVGHWFVRRSVDGGLTWATIDDVALGGFPLALTTDAVGNVYLVGEAIINNSSTWIVRKGTAGSAGLTWANIDSFSSGRANTVLATSAGLFVGGQVFKKGGTWLWTVRRSTNGGATWITVDSYSLGVGQNATANSLGADTSGIYSVGWANKNVKGRSVSDWIVRRSTDGGNSWTTIDDAGPNWGLAFGIDSQGNHYAAGFANGYWTVRENLANTSAWSTVDAFQSPYGAQPAALAGDASGNVFASGYAEDAGQNYHWIIRKR